MAAARVIILLSAIALASHGQWRQRPSKHAEPWGGTAVIEHFNRMPPAQRERFLNQLSPARRKVLEDRIDRFNQIPPAQREKLREEYERFRQLPPEQQEETRRAFREFSQLPKDQRKKLRTEMDAWRKMTQEEKQERKESKEFREKFDGPERKILRDMEHAVPPPEED